MKCNKKIRNVEFYGIKYKKIENVNDYCILEKEVEDLLEKGNKMQFLIDAENMKNESLEKKEISTTVCFSLVSIMLFGIVSFVMKEVFWEECYIIKIALNILAIHILVNTTKFNARLSNKKIIFYDTISKIIKDK